MSNAGAETASGSPAARKMSGRPRWLLLAWLLLGGFVLQAAASVVMGLPLFRMSVFEWQQLALVELAFFGSAALPLLFTWLGVPPRPVASAFFTVAVFAAAWYLASRSGLNLPAPGMATLALLAALLLSRQPGAGSAGWRLPSVLVGGAVGVMLAGLLASGGNAAAQSLYHGFRVPLSRQIVTSLYPLDYRLFRAPLPAPRVTGGGIAVRGPRILLLTGDGDFYRLEFARDDEKLTAVPLGYRVPNNAAEFRQMGLSRRQKVAFRVYAPLIVDAANGNLEILAAQNYWRAEAQCFGLRLSAFTAAEEDFWSGRAQPRWRTVYDSRPCLPLKVGDEAFYVGRQSGGRLLRAGPETVLLTVGDFGYDGVYGPHVAPQDAGSDYGKVIEIDLSSGTHRIVSSGLRNPQGLLRDSEGRVWATDQGPRGGDELNLIEEGGNYGWPLTTFGTQYFRYRWPLGDDSRPADSFVTPVFAWVPSVATTSLVRIEGGVLERWRGDLIVASLRAKALYRLHLDGDRVVYSEPIELGRRLRDLATDASGRLLVWTDEGAVALLRPLSADSRAP